MLKRRNKKLTKKMVTKATGRIMLTCCECEQEDVEVSSDIGKVTCAGCVQKMIAPPVGYKATEKNAPKKPRGWHLKLYFEMDGQVYSKGKLVTDKVLIKKLKAGPKPVGKNTTKRPKKLTRKKKTV